MPRLIDKSILRSSQKKRGGKPLGLESSSQKSSSSSAYRFTLDGASSTNRPVGLGSVSIKSTTRSTVASQSQLSRPSRGSTSSTRSMGRRIIGRIKSVGRKREKRKKFGTDESLMEPVPETVRTRAMETSVDLNGSLGKGRGVGNSLMPNDGADLIHIILFLVAPKSSRFEILVLDFDARKARVKDILSQIPVSAKEELFRSQRFSGVADKDGCEMIDSLKLSNYTSDSTVTVAIPDGMTSKESALLALPLMKDPRVNALLKKHTSNKSPHVDAPEVKPISASPAEASKEETVRELPQKRSDVSRKEEMGNGADSSLPLPLFVRYSLAFFTLTGVLLSLQRHFVCSFELFSFFGGGSLDVNPVIEEHSIHTTTLLPGTLVSPNMKEHTEVPLQDATSDDNTQGCPA